jgi:hypothetical protein
LGLHHATSTFQHGYQHLLNNSVVWYFANVMLKPQTILKIQVLTVSSFRGQVMLELAKVHGVIKNIH